MRYRDDIALHVPKLIELATAADYILELGCASGSGSTSAFAQGFKLNINGKRWISVDIRNQLRLALTPTDTRWSFLQGDTTSDATVDAVLNLCPTFRADLLFVDTLHTKAQMRRELAIWPRAAHERTVWVFHDTWMLGQYNDMTDAIKEYADANGLHYYDYSKESHGLGIMTYRQNT